MRPAAPSTRRWAVNSINARIHLKAEADRLKQEVALLREEIRLKDARMWCAAERSGDAALIAADGHTPTFDTMDFLRHSARS